MSTPLQIKKEVTAALEAEDYETILTLALKSRKILSVLVRFAYDKETLIGWRAIHAIGEVASVFVRSNYDFLRETIRKLLWSLSDESGGIGWAAPEILGEIVSADPEKMSDIIPLITEVYYIEEKVFRPGILYALKRIAETNPVSVTPYQNVVIDGLSDQEPLARLYALNIVDLLNSYILPENRERIRNGIESLLQDKSEAWIFKDGGFHGVVVGEYAKDIKNHFGSTVLK